MRFPDENGAGLSAFLEALAPGAVVDISPGQYHGPLTITRPVTLRGAGELTRISGGTGRPIRIETEGRVVLDSLRLEQGHDDDGGGLLVAHGDVHVRNLHIHHCRAAARGGAVAVRGGRLTASGLYTADTTADKGGALWIGGRGHLVLHEGQISRCEAIFGGAMAVEDAAVVEVDRLTVARARARSRTGGQALYAAGDRHVRPKLDLHRVKIENGSLGLTVVVDPAFPAEVRLRACDMPRTVMRVAGLVDAGANHWR
ncbi:MAG: hypothetical protein AAF449_09750 [Myxococcota bacterium]